jgi:hypothetical protein
MASMIDYSDASEINSLSWINFIGIVGASILCMAIGSNEVKKIYSQWRWVSFPVVSITLTLFVLICFYLLFIFISKEDLGHRYIVEESTWTVPLNALLLIFVQWLLNKVNKTSTS